MKINIWDNWYDKGKKKEKVGKLEDIHNNMRAACLCKVNVEMYLSWSLGQGPFTPNS